jgi:transposase
VGADRAVEPKVKRRYRYPRRRLLDNRKVLTGILFVFARSS